MAEREEPMTSDDRQRYVSTSPNVNAAARGRRFLGRYGVVLVPFLEMLVFGLWGIERQGSVWTDEAVTYQAAHRTIPELFDMLGHRDVVHGLYYVFMHVVFTIFGGSVVALRLPSVLAMSAAAGGIGLIGRRLIGTRAGLLAGCAFPLIPIVQWYAQEGRSYAIVVALVTWSTWLLLKAVDDGSKRTWVAYGALMAIACWFHEFAVLALLAHGMTLLLARVPRSISREWAVTGACAIIVLSPLALLSWQQREQQLFWLTAPAVLDDLWVFPQLALIGLLSSFAPVRSKGRIQLRQIALPILFVPTAVLVLLSYTLTPLYVTRYTLYFTIAVALLFGAALDWVWRTAGAGARPVVWRPLSLALVASLLLGVFVLVPSWNFDSPAAIAGFWSFQRTAASHGDDMSATARAVGRLGAPGDGLLFIPTRLRIAKEAFPADFRGLEDLALAQDAVASGTLYGVELPPSQIRARILAAKRIIVVANEPSYDQPSDRIEQEVVKRETIAQHFSACRSEDTPDVRITVFAIPGSC
jgi:mannosyltransferase